MLFLDWIIRIGNSWSASTYLQSLNHSHYSNFLKEHLQLDVLLAVLSPLFSAMWLIKDGKHVTVITYSQKKYIPSFLSTCYSHFQLSPEALILNRFYRLTNSFCFSIFDFTVRTPGKCSPNSPFLHNNNLQLTSSSGGTFRSPSYPSYYPGGMVCTWKITVLSNKRIKLYFDNFRLESGLCSSNDYLEVRDGPSSTSLRKGTYCGSSAPPTITSSGRYLWVRFRSDSQTTYRGFQARYEVISKSQSKSCK